MLAYTDKGISSGPVLVFVHGFCEDSRMWQYFTPAFAKGFRILQIDLPGFGKSKKTPMTSLQAAAEEVSTVLDHEKIKKCIYIGHSMGGYVGLEIAAVRPELLRGFCLFHSHPYGDTEEQKTLRTRSAKLIREGGRKAFVHRVINSLFPNDFDDRQVINRLLRRAEKMPVETLASATEAMRDRANRSAALKHLDCPVQFIIGTEDNAVPLPLSTEQTALPAVADIRIMRGTGHMGMFEVPDKTKRMIREFAVFCEEFETNR